MLIAKPLMDLGLDLTSVKLKLDCVKLLVDVQLMQLNCAKQLLETSPLKIVILAVEVELRLFAKWLMNVCLLKKLYLVGCLLEDVRSIVDLLYFGVVVVVIVFVDLVLFHEVLDREGGVF